MARPPSRELLERARQIDRLLRSRNTPFAFMGGLAVNAWAIPAPTLLAVQRQLDWRYVRTWASRFGIVERYREALDEAGLREEGSAS